MNSIFISLCLSAPIVAQPLPTQPAPQLLPPGPGLPGPTPLLAAPLPPPPLTYEQFSKDFVPFPGIHDVTVIHPVTRLPVNFVFRLPNLPLKKIHRGATRLTYDYGKEEVTLIFRIINGKVDVRYD